MFRHTTNVAQSPKGRPYTDTTAPQVASPPAARPGTWFSGFGDGCCKHVSRSWPHSGDPADRTDRDVFPPRGLFASKGRIVPYCAEKSDLACDIRRLEIRSSRSRFPGRKPHPSHPVPAEYLDPLRRHVPTGILAISVVPPLCPSRRLPGRRSEPGRGIYSCRHRPQVLFGHGGGRAPSRAGTRLSGRRRAAAPTGHAQGGQGNVDQMPF